MSLPTTSNVTRPRGLGYSFRLGDLYLRGSVAPDRSLEITTAPLEAQKVNTATSSEDLRNEFGAIFSRTQFTGGEGLDFAHQRDLPEDAAARYWDSKHIDISNLDPNEPNRITLLPATANVEASTDTNLHLTYDGTGLNMGEGTTTRRSTDPLVASPTFANESTGAAVTVLDLTSLGVDLYAAQGANKIYKRTGGGTWAQLASAPTTQKVWAAKLLLLAATGTAGSVLSEISTSDGTETVRVTLPNGKAWLDVKDCGLAILACAEDGNVYALANSAGTLTLQAQTPMPAGEVPYTVAFDGTFVFVATREATASGAIGRVYRMTLGANHVLGDATLLRQWGDQSATIDHAPRQMIRNRKGIVWGVYETGGAFLWRYDSATAGVSRHLDLGASGLVVDIISVGSRLFATVSGHGLRREQVGTYEQDGYLIGPLGDLFNASQKSWAGAMIDHETIASNTRIELYYTTDPSALSDPDATAWIRVKNIAVGLDNEETRLRDVNARFLAGMVKLYADTDLDTSPVVRGFAFRSYPGPGDVEIVMAVNTSDLITRPGRRSIRSRGAGRDVYDALKGKEGRADDLEVLATGEVFRGVVKQVSTRIPDEVERGSASVVTMVTFRGRRVSSAGDSQSDAALSVGMLGVMFVGGQET